MPSPCFCTTTPGAANVGEARAAVNKIKAGRIAFFGFMMTPWVGELVVCWVLQRLADAARKAGFGRKLCWWREVMQNGAGRYLAEIDYSTSRARFIKIDVVI